MTSNTTQSSKQMVLKGIPTSPGIAIGPAYIFRPFSINMSELEVRIADVDAEIAHFENAIEKVLEQLEYAQMNSEENYDDQFSDIFESQKAFLRDPYLINEIKQNISNSKHSAAHVISKVLSEKSEHFINLENTYFRERAYDIIDLKQKLIHALLGIDIDYQLSKPSIVIAEILTPSDTINFNRNFILGFLTDKGGKTSHAAILARGLRIPSVVNGSNLSKFIQHDEMIIVDGFSGKIILNPDEATKDRYLQLQDEFQSFEDELLKEIDKEARTIDEKHIYLHANIEFLHEVNDVKINRADGIGLFRTESLYIGKKAEPTEEEQLDVYTKLLEQLHPAPVVIRTMDLGGDKLLEGYSSDNESNPFLGWRAIRFCLDRPQVFKTQLRAIYRAGPAGNVKILLPMISSVEEMMRVTEIIDEIKRELQLKDIPFSDHVELGIMIETPSAAMLIPFLANYADFFSIGTNDLTQYVLAIDRTNARVSKYYNTFNPAVLQIIEQSIRLAETYEREITLCGEFAAVPEAIPLLLGMGLKHLSMTPFYLPEAKKIIRSVDTGQCRQLLEEVKQLSTADAVEKECTQFLKNHVPDLKFLK